MEPIAKFVLGVLDAIEAEMRLLLALSARWALGMFLSISFLVLGIAFGAYGASLWLRPRVGGPLAFGLVGLALALCGWGCCLWASGSRRRGS
ncbi:hypothetical protein [Thermanaerovibrio acidaminovorans]|jgi:hypothetical protein|uniref:Uncharacterized protein n=1 Tax=Thermanaerovibrio acidaminovorans (strain ATCC 49978 / DSM 6589 / Su883) TaxID=525903 RepID=D1B8L8_THEAS|nr:hypothetical protein [Thermanaerovibrio acidaminovorans]ACZ18621.1 hypothetical protein Taci_0384 [Thermanaerovibrio acidaminovorans DSM 6589]